MSTATHAGPGVEIEDDIVRFRQRKLEYEADAGRRTGANRQRTKLAEKAKQIVGKRWRWQRRAGGLGGNAATGLRRYPGSGGTREAVARHSLTPRPEQLASADACQECGQVVGGESVCHTVLMFRRRVQFVAAQLGLKAGEGEALAGLLSGSDLPDGPWRVMDQRTWRTGEIGPATPWGERARQAGSVAAWRSFSHETAPRWAWIQVIPMASEEDAGAAMSGIGERALANLRSAVRLVSQREVPVEPFAGASAVWALEQQTESRDGPGVVLTLAGAVSLWLVVVCLSGSPVWDWPSASGLAALQAARLSG